MSIPSFLSLACYKDAHLLSLSGKPFQLLFFKPFFSQIPLQLAFFNSYKLHVYQILADSTICDYRASRRDLQCLGAKAIAN
jgi:hypothetical protein